MKNDKAQPKRRRKKKTKHAISNRVWKAAGQTQITRCQECGYGTPMLIPMTGNGMVMWRPPLFDYGRKD